MTPWLVSSQEWLVRSSLAGGALLLLGVGLMFLTRQPARRQRIGELALGCSLLVALLCALPAWTPWSIPLWEKPATPAAEKPKPDGIREIIVLQEPHKLLALAAKPDGALPVGETADVGALALDVQDGLAWSTAALPVDPSDAEEGDEPRWLAALVGGWAIVAPWLVGFYLLMTLALFLRCTLGFAGLRRLWRTSEAPPAHVRALLEERTDGWRRRPRLGVSTRITLPVSFGLLKPTILIPWSFCRPIKHDDLRQVLVHELTHLKRLDAWSCLLIAVGQVVYFHLPWFWWLRKQVRLCQEYVADAAAAALSTTEDYAEYLVSLSKYAAPRLPVGAKVMGVKGTTSDLFRRVAMLLNGSREVENRPPRWWSALTGAAFIGVAVLMSGIGLRSAVHADDSKKEASKDVIIRAHVVSDDGDKSEKQVIWLQADPKVEGKFIRATPESGKRGSFIAVPVDGKEQKFIAVEPDGKKAIWVTAQPAEGKQSFRVTADSKDGKTYSFAAPGSPDGKVHAWIQQAEPKGGKQAFYTTTPPAEGKRVQVQDLGDGKRIIIIIDDSESTKSGDKKPEPKRTSTIVKPAIVKPVDKVIERAVIVEDGQKQAAEAVRRALEQIKKSGKDVDADVRKALEEAMKRLEQLDKDGAFKKAGQVDWIKKEDGDVRRQIEVLRQAEKVQGEKAAAEYRKAFEAAHKALGAAQEKAKGAASDADKKAKGAAVEAEKKLADVYHQLKTTRTAKPTGARLGVSVSTLGEALLAQLDLDKEQGLVIDQVFEGSAAEKAGFKAHDILVEFNGKEVSSNVEAFVKAVQELKPGANVSAVVLRKGRKTAIKGIVLAEAKPEVQLEFKLNPELGLERKLRLDLKQGEQKPQGDLQEGELKKLIELKRDGVLKKVQELLKDPRNPEVDIFVPGEKIKSDQIERFDLEKVKIKSGETILELKDVDFVKPVKPAGKIDPKPVLRGKVVTFPNPVEPLLGREVKPIEVDQPVLIPVEVILDEPVRFLARTILPEQKERTVKITCERNNDDFTCKHEEENLKITVKGSTKNEKAAVKSIVIDANGKETKVETLAKVPDDYKERVKKLIELVEKGKVDFEVKD